MGALDFLLEAVEGRDVIDAFIFVQKLVLAHILLFLRLLGHLLDALKLLSVLIIQQLLLMIVIGPLLRAYALLVHMVLLL